MHPILLDLGFIQIHSYGVMLSLGVVLAIFTASLLAKKYDIPSDFILDLSVKVLIFGIIGSKLLFLIVNIEDYLYDPVNIIRDIRSGFVFMGGMVLAFAIAYRYVKKSPYDLYAIFDIFAPAVPLGHAFGRLGCYMAGCCYGKIASKESIFTISFCNEYTVASPVCTPLIATQPISAIFLFLLSAALIFLFYYWKTRPQGSLFFVYLLFYTLFRFFIEFFRGDPRGGALFISTSQLLSIIIVPLAILFIIRSVKGRNKGKWTGD